MALLIFHEESFHEFLLNFQKKTRYKYRATPVDILSE